MLYDDEAAAAVVYGPLQHEELPPEATESRKRNPPPPVVWTTSSRQSAVVVGRAAFCPRLAATAASSAQQTRTADSDAVQADMTANGKRRMLFRYVRRERSVCGRGRCRWRSVAVTACELRTADGREPKTATTVHHHNHLTTTTTAVAIYCRCERRASAVYSFLSYPRPPAVTHLAPGADNNTILLCGHYR